MKKPWNLTKPSFLISCVSGGERKVHRREGTHSKVEDAGQLQTSLPLPSPSPHPHSYFYPGSHFNKVEKVLRTIQ
jgi:hypothetical protein